MSSQQNQVDAEECNSHQASNRTSVCTDNNDNSTSGNTTRANKSQKENVKQANPSPGKNDERTLIEIAQDDFSEVRNEPAHRGGGPLESSEESHSFEDEGVAKVPNVVFQRQNTFVRTGGKEGELPNDKSHSK